MYYSSPNNISTISASSTYLGPYFIFSILTLQAGRSSHGSSKLAPIFAYKTSSKDEVFVSSSIGLEIVCICILIFIPEQISHLTNAPPDRHRLIRQSCNPVSAPNIRLPRCISRNAYMRFLLCKPVHQV